MAASLEGSKNYNFWLIVGIATVLQVNPDNLAMIGLVDLEIIGLTVIDKNK